MASKILLLLSGAVFSAVGALHIIAPQAGVEPLGLELATLNSLNEIRANYGGMHLILGLFMLIAGIKDSLRKPGLFLLAFFTGGLVLGRVVSLIVDGVPGSVILGFLAIESIGCLLATVLIVKEARENAA